MFPLLETALAEVYGSNVLLRGVTAELDEPYQVSAQVPTQLKMRIVKLMKALPVRLAPGWETGERVTPFRITVGDVFTPQQFSHVKVR